MAVYYALPALTNWGSFTDAFSLSSGGTPLTVTPTYTDDIIFDSASGPARTIAGVNMSCRHLTFNPGVNAITLSLSNLLSTYGNVTLQPNIVIIALWYIYSGGFSLIRIISNGAILQTSGTTVYSSQGYAVEFTDNFVTTGGVTQAGSGTISFLGTYYSFARVNFPSGGTVTFAANQVFEVTGTTTNLWNCSSDTTLSIPASHTIKFTGKLASAANASVRFQASKLYANVWFDNGGTLTNYLTLENLNCTSLRVFPGAYLKVETGTSLVATNWQVEGLKSKGIVFVASGGTATLYNNSMSVPVTVQHTYFGSGYTVGYGPMKSIHTPPGSTTPTGMALLQTPPNFGSFF